ncbi:hypothetical protein RFI_00117 [Reticulomyxa filosa]|uniref:Uncharacterized protein n=1 Tax=Reticulomyxa filosa TaxID=46433 RepID=X6PEN7_RETFI|nr:hypothetical protein RFI_00117 [Reticulomyxa filosa]|eukprot:ETO36945.1 hypothetical protein RFI_00117 [Reticulomyxa filosa]
MPPWNLFAMIWLLVTYVILVPLCCRELRRYWKSREKLSVRKPEIGMALFVMLIKKKKENNKHQRRKVFCVFEVTLTTRLWLSLFTNAHDIKPMIPETFNMILILLVAMLRLWHIVCDNHYRKHQAQILLSKSNNSKKSNNNNNNNVAQHQPSCFQRFKQALTNPFLTWKLTALLFFVIVAIFVLRVFFFFFFYISWVGFSILIKKKKKKKKIKEKEIEINR